MTRQITTVRGKVILGIVLFLTLALVGVFVVAPLSEWAAAEEGPEVVYEQERTFTEAESYYDPTDPEEMARPMCTIETAGCPTASRVRTVPIGIRKYNNGALGRAPGAVPYTDEAQRAIVGAIAAARNWTRARGWTHLQKIDNCVTSAKLEGTHPRGPLMTCEGMRVWRDWQSAHKGDWKPIHIRVSVCGAITGVTWKGALAQGALRGPGGLAVAGGIIAGGASCAFLPNLEQLAD